MGLVLPQTVKIRIGNKNGKYYENLGYNVRKEPTELSKKKGRITPVINVGLELEIPVEDLNPTSNTKIYCTCDDCGKLLYIHNNIYEKNKNTGILCYQCAMSRCCGPNHHAWNPNLTEEQRILKRTGFSYHKFVGEVMKRDKYTCQACEKKSNKIEVHHLNGYNWCIEGRLDVTNGITLCKDCHDNFHNVYGKKDNTKEQFFEWLGRRMQLGQDVDLNILCRKIVCLENRKIYETVFSAANDLKLHRHNIYANLNKKARSAKGKHFVYLDEYEKMSEEDIKNTISNIGQNHKNDYRMICLNDGLLYESVKLASKNTNYSEITIRSSGVRNYKNIKDSKFRKNIWTKWLWYEDFIKLSISEMSKLLKLYQNDFNQGSFLYVLNSQLEKLDIDIIIKTAEERTVK